MRKVLLISMALALCGCATQRFDVRTPATPYPALDEAQTFWIGGVGQDQELDATRVCGSSAKVVRVEMEQTAGNLGVSLLTLGVYSPRQVRVYCAR
jgi:hypothetical protein